MPCICAIAGAIPPDYVDASYSSKTEKKASVDAEGNFDPKPVDTTKYDRSERYRITFPLNTFPLKTVLFDHVVFLLLFYLAP